MLIAICIEGCKDKLAEEAIGSDLIGKWILAKSYNSSDTVFVGNSWLELKQDKSFSSNSSFFWRTDSLKYLPLNGKWSVSVTEIPSGGRQGFVFQSIVLEVNSEKSWALSYNTTQMFWSDTGQIQHTWNLQK